MKKAVLVMLLSCMIHGIKAQYDQIIGLGPFKNGFNENGIPEGYVFEVFEDGVWEIRDTVWLEFDQGRVTSLEWSNPIKRLGNYTYLEDNKLKYEEWRYNSIQNQYLKYMQSTIGTTIIEEGIVPNRLHHSEYKGVHFNDSGDSSIYSQNIIESNSESGFLTYYLDRRIHPGEEVLTYFEWDAEEEEIRAMNVLYHNDDIERSWSVTLDNSGLPQTLYNEELGMRYEIYKWENPLRFHFSHFAVFMLVDGQMEKTEEVSLTKDTVDGFLHSALKVLTFEDGELIYESVDRYIIDVETKQIHVEEIFFNGTTNSYDTLIITQNELGQIVQETMFHKSESEGDLQRKWRKNFFGHTTSVNDQVQTPRSLTLFPNPVSNEFSFNQTPGPFEIRSIDGKVLKHYAGRSLSYDMAVFRPGVYVVTVTNTGQVLRVLKE